MAMVRIRTIFLLFAAMPTGEATDLLLSTEPFTSLQTEMATTALNIYDLEVGIGSDCSIAILSLCTKLNIPVDESLVSSMFCKCFGECPGPDTAAHRQLRQEIVIMNARRDGLILENLIIICVLCAIFVVGIAANVLVIIILLKYLPRENVTNMFLLSLSLSDILLLVVCIPVRTVKYVGYFLILPDEANWICYFTQFMFYYSFVCSTLTLTIIGIERYLALCHPMKAQKIGSVGRAQKTIICIWIVSLILCAPSLLGVDVKEGACILDDGSLPTIQYHIYYFFVVVLCIPLLVLSTVYIRICITLWKSVGHLNQQASLSTEKQGKNGRNTKDDTGERKQLICLMIAVLLAFAVCWTPLLLFHVIEFEMKKRNLMTIGYFDDIAKALDVLTFSNAILVPILYAFLSRQFREGLKKCLKSTGEKTFDSAFGTAVDYTESHQTYVKNFQQVSNNDAIIELQACKEDVINDMEP